MKMETARTVSALFDKYSWLEEGTDERTLDCPDSTSSVEDPRFSSPDFVEGENRDDFQPPNCLLLCDDNLWASRDARVTYHRLPFRSEETLPVLASQET